MADSFEGRCAKHAFLRQIGRESWTRRSSSLLASLGRRSLRESSAAGNVVSRRTLIGRRRCGAGRPGAVRRVCTLAQPELFSNGAREDHRQATRPRLVGFLLCPGVVLSTTRTASCCSNATPLMQVVNAAQSKATDRHADQAAAAAVRRSGIPGPMDNDAADLPTRPEARQTGGRGSRAPPRGGAPPAP
jgi:hypothetical protein